MAQDNESGFHEPSHSELLKGAKVTPREKQGVEGHRTAREKLSDFADRHPNIDLRRSAMRRRALAGLTVLGLAGGFGGVAAAHNGGNPDTSRPPGISQQFGEHGKKLTDRESQKNSLAHTVDASLEKLGIDTDARLITSNSKIEQVSQHVIQALMGTSIGELSAQGGGTVGKRLDDLQKADIHEIKKHFSAETSSDVLDSSLNLGDGAFGDTTFGTTQSYSPIGNGEVMENTTITFYVDKANQVLINPMEASSPFTKNVLTEGSQNLRALVNKLGLSGSGTRGEIPDIDGSSTPSINFKSSAGDTYQFGNDGFLVITTSQEIPQSQAYDLKDLAIPTSNEGVIASIGNVIVGEEKSISADKLSSLPLPDISTLKQLNNDAGKFDGKSIGDLQRLYEVAK